MSRLVACISRRARLVGVDLLHVPDIPATSPPQILDDLHAFERRAQAIGGDVHLIHDGLTRSVGRDPRLFVGDTRRLGGVPADALAPVELFRAFRDGRHGLHARPLPVALSVPLHF